MAWCEVSNRVKAQPPYNVDPLKEGVGWCFGRKCGGLSGVVSLPVLTVLVTECLVPPSLPSPFLLPHAALIVPLSVTPAVSGPRKAVRSWGTKTSVQPSPQQRFSILITPRGCADGFVPRDLRRSTLNSASAAVRPSTQPSAAKDDWVTASLAR